MANVSDSANASMPSPGNGIHSLEPPRKKFCFLHSRLNSSTTASAAGRSSSVNATLESQFSKYCSELGECEEVDAVQFWIDRLRTYNKLAQFALDLVAAPASEAYCERIFSVCGLLTVGRRNRMKKSLEMRVFLKLNRGLTSTTSTNESSAN